VARSGPLADLVVLDLTRILAGPYCTMVLADLGARVIKVERPPGGDDARSIGPFRGGRSAYFDSVNRGKESIALDLKVPGDRGIFEALVERADILVENFRPGALARLGYGWEALHARHPRLIYAAISGFGQTGPRVSRPAYDIVVQALGGIMSLTGQPGSAPTRVGTSIGDIAAGLFAAVGIGSALHQRERTGEGSQIDVAMLDGQVAILENAIARHLATGEVPGPLGSRHPSIAPFAAFTARDRSLVIAAGNDMLFGRLCEVIGRPDLVDDRRFLHNDDRARHWADLARELDSALAAHDADEWLARLEASGVPCAPIQDVAEVLADPQVTARNMVINAGESRMAGNPVKLSGHDDPSERRSAPAFDADRPRILAELGIGS
jgi:CoA:oxalate CoA-transferase